MKAEFLTCSSKKVSVNPSSNIYRRVWLRIEDDLKDTKQATELSVWDCKILIRILERAAKHLEEDEK